MQTTKKEAKDKLQDDWLSLFRCCSRDPEQIARMVKAAKQFITENEKETTKNYQGLHEKEVP